MKIQDTTWSMIQGVWIADQAGKKVARYNGHRLVDIEELNKVRHSINFLWFTAVPYSYIILFPF